MFTQEIQGRLALAAGDRAIRRSGLRPANQHPRVLIVIGYVAGALLPLIGLIIGVVLILRGGSARRHGRWIAMIAIALLLIGAAAQVEDPGRQTGSAAQSRIQGVNPWQEGLTPEERALLREVEHGQGR